MLNSLLSILLLGLTFIHLGNVNAQKNNQLIDNLNYKIDSLTKLIQSNYAYFIETTSMQSETNEELQRNLNQLKLDKDNLLLELKLIKEKAEPLLSLEGLEYYFVYQKKNRPVVVIGSQHWMLENLHVTTFQNGDSIPFINSKKDWEIATENKQPAWCYYDDDSVYNDKFGILYNWYAVNDPRGLAPKGWKIASEKDFSVLNEYLGNDSGKKMKYSDYWLPFGCVICNQKKEGISKCKACKGKKYLSSQPFTGVGNNHSGFRAMPGGSRFSTGEFDAWSKESQLGRFGFWWCSNSQNEKLANYVELKNTSDMFDLYGTKDKGTGMSVRCILIDKKP